MNENCVGVHRHEVKDSEAPLLFGTLEPQFQNTKLSKIK